MSPFVKAAVIVGSDLMGMVLAILLVIGVGYVVYGSRQPDAKLLSHQIQTVEHQIPYPQ